MAVHIVTPHASYDTTAEALGLSIDQPTTVDAVMKVGHKDNVLVRPFRMGRVARLDAQGRTGVPDRSSS